MKQILLTLSISLLTIASHAQYDPAARTLLDKVAKNNKSWKTVKINFETTITTADTKVEEKHNGTLWQKNEKYKLNFMGTETYFNGKNRWVYMPDVGEVNLYDVKDNDCKRLLDNPQQIFTIYTKGFKYQLVAEIKEVGKTISEVELVPEDKNVEYFKIKIYIDNKDNRLTQIKYFAKDGSRVTINITNYVVNDEISDSNFTFDTSKHKDIMVIDMTE